MKLTDFALKNRTSVFVMVGIVALWGAISYFGLPREAFPDIKQPIIIVSAPYTGVAPADMETLVADPLEEKLKEITQIKTLTSSSREGVTTVVAEFEPDMDVDEALRRVKEKTDQAKADLPDDLNDVFVQEVNFENIPVLVVSLTGDQSLLRLKGLAEDLKDKIEEVPGVLSVDITGGLTREVKVNLNPSRLVHYNLGVDDVIAAIRRENLTVPGGATESASLKWSIRIPGELESMEDIEGLVVSSAGGNPVYLRDLASVSFGFKEQESYARLNGKSSVTLSVSKRSGQNIIRLVDEVKAILERDGPSLPAGTRYTVVTDLSKDIRTLVEDLENNILSGLLLAVLVLYFFMGARNGFIVGVAIPLSLFISFIVLTLLGYTLNFIMLFSLILVLGMFVDNAIVVVENIYRHHEEGKPLLQAAREATDEVAVAIASSTATNLIAFIPLLFWQGIMGEFMKYLPITVIVTLTSSLFVALVMTPVISSRFLKLDSRKGKQPPGDRLMKWMAAGYEKSLARIAATRRSRARFLIGVGMAFVVMTALFVVFNHGVEFFPSLQPNYVYVEVEAPLGTRLAVSDKAVRILEDRLSGIPDVENRLAAVGASSDIFDFGAGAGTPHRSKITIDLLDKAQRSQSSFATLDEVTQAVQGVPGVRVDVSREEEGPPTGKPVEVRIKGEDFAVLSKLSEEVQARIRDVRGIAKLDDDYEKGKPELRVKIDREKAALLGLDTAGIASTIRTAINGTEASKYRVGSEDYDITVRLDRDYRQSYTDILNLTVFHEGKHYPLANFATVELSTGLSSVNHVGGDRVVTVSADAVGRSAAEVLADAKSRLAGLPLPAGYTATFTGQNQEQDESQSFLTGALLLGLVGIFLLLVIQFNSVTLPFVVMLSVLLSLFGVFFGLLVTFMPFGIIMTGLGVISLAGVVVNNAIVLIEYIQQLRERGVPKLEAVVVGARTRLRPVLLSTITGLLSLIPLALGVNLDFLGLLHGHIDHFIQTGVESAQWWTGMAVVVIFGLLFATILTLAVVPVCYYMLADVLSDVRFPAARTGGAEETTENGEQEESA